MLFNSFSYAVFLPIVFVIYWAIPNKFRWILLLLASYYFYMSWNVKYVFLIVFITFMSYVLARLLEKESDRRKKKWILISMIAICLGILFFFKYFNFFMESINDVLRMFALSFSPVTLKLILPVGISFYTFQTISYVIDVYRGDIPAEHHFGKYALFVSFFPQLVAGPIERTDHLMPQVKAEHTFNYEQASYGLKLMAWGYFKKIVIADTLSQYVSYVYNAPQNYTGFVLIVATVFFSIQIYCDFSGYSDIAVGTARLFGIQLMTNFKSPYFSESIKEFWNRWHISLSCWFRDYVYIPLGGNRVSPLRHGFNLMITFLVSGLWHGADWTFVVWGGLHGAAQILENSVLHLNRKKKSSAIKVVKTIMIFAFCSFAWIFFVSASINDAVYVISHMFCGIKDPVVYLRDGVSAMDFAGIDKIVLCISLFILFLYDYVSLKNDVICIISSRRIVVRWAVYCIFVLWIIMNVPYNYSGEFIYFQF